MATQVTNCHSAMSVYICLHIHIIQLAGIIQWIGRDTATAFLIGQYIYLYHSNQNDPKSHLTYPKGIERGVSSPEGKAVGAWS